MQFYKAGLLIACDSMGNRTIQHEQRERYWFLIEQITRAFFLIISSVATLDSALTICIFEV